MSTGSSPEGGAPLQFDQADYSSEGSPGETAEAGITCGICRQPLADTYYEANGQVLCQICKPRLEAELTRGSGGGRFFRAALFGGVVALLGSSVYYGIRALTEYELSIVAIALGWLIGAAIRKGTYGRGGLVYQFGAVALTYASISFSYVPDLVMAFMKEAGQERGELAAGAGNKAPAPFAVAPLRAAEGETTAAVEPAAPGEPSAPAATAQGETSTTAAGTLDGTGSEPVEPPSAAAFAFAVVVALGITLSIPVVMATSSPMLFLIYGFGLLQAWQMNKKLHIAISGPFSLDSRPPQPPVSLSKS